MKTLKEFLQIYKTIYTEFSSVPKQDVMLAASILTLAEKVNENQCRMLDAMKTLTNTLSAQTPSWRLP